MAHGEVKTYQLTPEELAEVIEKYGEPTQPLNTYKSRWYKSDPETRKYCTRCERKHYALGFCKYHYNKAHLESKANDV
jgi:hypothetical protein